MTAADVRRKVVKSLAKGQVTIPAEFREALGIEPDTLLDVSLVGDHLELIPLRQGEDVLRRYTEEEVSRFTDEDKLNPEVRKRVHKLLRQGAL